jgi:hypothetical protein
MRKISEKEQDAYMSAIFTFHCDPRYQTQRLVLLRNRIAQNECDQLGWPRGRQIALTDFRDGGICEVCRVRIDHLPLIPHAREGDGHLNRRD